MNVLGVDIGGTKIAVGIVDGETGMVLHSDRTPTQASQGGAAVLARALALSRQAISAASAEGIEPPVAVGIGAGGQIDYRTGVVLAATDILPGWAGTRLAESFAETFGVPAFADNDVNAFALGEHRFGAARGASDAVFLALGTGVGGAVLIGGQLLRGAHGGAGELGHLIIANDVRGIPATLEYFTGGPALVRHFRVLVATNRARAEKEFEGEGPVDELDGAAIGQAAFRDLDGLAATAARTLGEYLGRGLASLANVLDPERFIIGGGLLSLGDLILEPARAGLASRGLPAVKQIPVVPAALGRDSAVVGAACVALARL